MVNFKHARNVLAESSNDLSTGNHFLYLIIFNSLKIFNAQALTLHFIVVFFFKFLALCDSLFDIVCDCFEQRWKYADDCRVELLFVKDAELFPYFEYIFERRCVMGHLLKSH